MKPIYPRRRDQQGAVLVIALVLMLIASLVGAYMAANVGQDLRMTRNAQEVESAVESADAGVAAVLMLSAAATTNAGDPLRGANVANPFAGIAAADHPLRNLPDGAGTMTVAVARTDEKATCPPLPAEQASSIKIFACDYYDIQSAYNGTAARAQVNQGVWRYVPQ